MILLASLNLLLGLTSVIVPLATGDYIPDLGRQFAVLMGFFLLLDAVVMGVV